MAKYKIPVMFIYILMSSISYGWGQSITGRVIDEQSQPMAFASVVLINCTDSSFVSGAVTKDDGTFTIESDHNDGLLKVSSVGYIIKYINARQGSMATY